MENSQSRFAILATLIYIALGVGWIFLSDNLLLTFTDINSVIMLSTAKGLFFVFASGLGFFFALRVMTESTSTRNISIQNMALSGASISRRPAWITYSFAVIITGLMLLIRLNMGVTSDHRPLMILFVPPILLSALLGGFGPGLVATTLSAIGINYFVLQPINSFEILDSYDFVQWSTLIICGLIVSIFSEILLRAKSKAEDNLNLLNTIISGSNDPIYVKDINGKYLFINQAAANFTGRSIEEILGNDDKQLFHESVAEQIISRDQDFFSGGYFERHEQQLITKDGKSMLVDVNKKLIFDNAGNKVGLFGISRDITSIKEQEEQRLNQEIQLRKTLVREVHHHIKNNLQGATGILEQSILYHPELTEVINKVSSKIQSIASIHGLQGQNLNSEVILQEMLEKIIVNNQLVWGDCFILSTDLKISKWVVIESEAVPLALVINELLLNAFKHQSLSEKKVNIFLSENVEKKNVIIDITNKGNLLEISENSISIDKSTGLALVKVLLPKSGAEFTLVEDEGSVSARLILSEPIIVNLK